MDWISIGQSAAVGAAAGGLAALVAAPVRKFTDNKNVHILVLVAAWAGFSQIGEITILSKLRASRATANARANIEKVLMNRDGLIGLLISDNPELYGPVKGDLVKAFEQGGLKALSDRSAEIGRKLGENYMGQYISRASDETVEQFFKVLLVNLQTLQKENAVGCYYWLYGGGPVDSWTDYVDTEELGAVMKAVIYSGIKEKRPPPDIVQSDLVNDLVQKMLARYAVDDLFFGTPQSGNPAQTDDERSRGCLTALALYQELDKYPPQRKIDAVRVLLGPD